MTGRAFFVGGGPGAPDLLTVRGARAVAAADIVIWGRNLLMDEAVTEHARPSARHVPWPPATMEEILALYAEAGERGLTVTRLFSGDPALFGKLQPELEQARRLGLPYEIVPGVSSLGAAAALLECELTTPSGERTLILAAHAEGDVPPGERVRELARHGATMALFVSSKHPHELQAELLAGGYAPDTPCGVVHAASWPDQLAFCCRLDELAARVGADLERRTLILVGPALQRARPR